MPSCDFVCVEERGEGGGELKLCLRSITDEMAKNNLFKFHTNSSNKINSNPRSYQHHIGGTNNFYSVTTSIPQPSFLTPQHFATSQNKGCTLLGSDLYGHKEHKRA